MSIILKGKPVSDAIISSVKQRASALRKNGIIPTVAVVRFGAKADDLAYERGIKKSAENAGIEVKIYEMPELSSQSEAEDLITQLNKDDKIHGVLIFKPLPWNIDEESLRNVLVPYKDIDGITDAAIASLYSGNERYSLPCTAKACVEILKYYGIDISGKNVAVIGRSPVIGKPAALLLIKENATVTICHSKTGNLSTICKNSDIIIACAGNAEMVKREFMNENQTIIDVGINFDKSGKMIGDVKFDDANGFVKAVTPVPGGVGAVTTAVLMDNLLNLAEWNIK